MRYLLGRQSNSYIGTQFGFVGRQVRTVFLEVLEEMRRHLHEMPYKLLPIIAIHIQIGVYKTFNLIIAAFVLFFLGLERGFLNGAQHIVFI